MSRIPEEGLLRLKTEVSIVELAEARGVELKRHGRDLVGRCPFHEDKTPSLVVTPAKNLWHCLGACQAGGSVIDWVMREQGISFRHAVELLREKRGMIPAPDRPVKVSSVRKLPSPIDVSATERQALRQVVDYYHETLLRSPEALAYLESRGLTPAKDLAERFRLGYANRTLGYRLPQGNRQAGAAIRGKLIKVGILRRSGHEHLRGCLTIPIFDDGGKVLEVYGRRMGSGAHRHLYLPGPHRGVWNEESIGKEVILCEALLDALTFWCHGFRNVTASYGVNGFTKDHLAALHRQGVRKVLIAYDRDEAGDRAADSLALHLIAEGFDCYRVSFPRRMDANEYALKVKPPATSLDILLRTATWLGKRRSEEEAAKERNPQEAGDDEQLSSLAAKAASPEPSPLPAAFVVEETDQMVRIRFGEREYRVMGLSANAGLWQMKVNLMARNDCGFHVDTFDLYAARFRGTFVKQAGEELGIEQRVVKRDVGRVLLKLEELQEARLKKQSEPKEKAPKMTAQERKEALLFLRDPKLIDRLLEDFKMLGVVGEEVNKLTAYLAAVSRKDERPLAVIVQSSSAAGKTTLMDAVLSLIPEEERVQYSALTGQALFYLGEKDLKHKILAISEEEGAMRASYALKLLQTEGKLSIASTGKDPATGRLVTREYEVEGPVMIFITTTAVEIDEELQNRCLVLTVDEEREQTRAIHRVQRERETLEGLMAERKKRMKVRLHQNAQRLLKPMLVRNPYARELTFLDTKTRTRRDHTKYLALIRALAILHQHQRPKKSFLDPEAGEPVEYIDVALSDIAVANRLAHQVLGRSLAELSATTERLLFALEENVKAGCERQGIAREDYRFTRRETREAIGWSDFQVRKHLGKLVELEYVLVHRGGRGQSFVYELLYDGQGKDRASFLIGLVDVEKLRNGGQIHEYDSKFEQQTGGVERLERRFEPQSSPQRAPSEHLEKRVKLFS